MTPGPELLAAIARNVDPRVPLPIALTIVEHETGGTWDPKARGAAGEYGLFQLLPRTVRGADINYQGPLERLYEPELNTKLGTGYLALLNERFGTWPVAIRAYNGSGPAAQTYAATVLKRLPTWDQFVTANAKMFQAAARSSITPLVIAAVIGLFLLSQHSEADAA